jgi:hypothetical protein
METVFYFLILRLKYVNRSNIFKFPLIILYTNKVFDNNINLYTFNQSQVIQHASCVHIIVWLPEDGCNPQSKNVGLKNKFSAVVENKTRVYKITAQIYIILNIWNLYRRRHLANRCYLSVVQQLEINQCV